MRQGRGPGAGGSALILAYHSISSGPAPLCIRPELFRRHLDVLVEEGAAALSLGDLAAALRRRELPPRAVAITFDDGYADVVASAAPLLRERGLRATVFCVAGHLGTTSDWPTLPARAPRLPLAAAAELAAAATDGTLEVGSHGFDHAPLVGAGEELLRRELVDSKRLLERSVGAPVRSFAYPYGLAPPPSAAAVLVAEYEAVCGGGNRRAGGGADPLALPRVDAHYLRPPALLRRAVRGGRAYLALRRAGGRARRLVLSDHRGRP